jgi:hypothetical protein
MINYFCDYVSKHVVHNKTQHETKEQAVELDRFPLAAGGGERIELSISELFLVSFFSRHRGGREGTRLRHQKHRHVLQDTTWASNANTATLNRFKITILIETKLIHCGLANISFEPSSFETV